jgi:hypothetical protein
MKGEVKNVQVESEMVLTTVQKLDVSVVQKSMIGVADKLKNAAH